MIDVRTEVVEFKAERQALEQQVKDIMAQLHASQLECQVLKNQGEIEGADTILKRLVCVFYLDRTDSTMIVLFRKNKSRNSVRSSNRMPSRRSNYKKLKKKMKN